jgi:diguanylate cyclase
VQRFWSRFPFKDARVRLLVWAALASLVCGVIDFGEPLENVLRSVRCKILPRPASGDIVFVGIDDRSVQTLGRWPWPRSVHAKLFDRLIEAGASRIFFDITTATPTDPGNDSLFAGSLSRHRGKIYLASIDLADRVSNKLTRIRPLPAFLRVARSANIYLPENAFGDIVELPYSRASGGSGLPSFAKAIANAPWQGTDTFKIDYSTDIQSIPTLSVVDVLEKHHDATRLGGKTVVIGMRSDLYGDRHRAIGKGIIPGTYIHIFGAETLKRGQPVYLGWIPVFLFGFLLSASFMFIARRRLSLLVLGAGVLALVTMPFVLERLLIFADIVPGTLMLTIVGARWAWLRYKKHVSGSIISGLPDLFVLRSDRTAAGGTLVATRIHNFAQITSALPAAMERELVRQITDRLTLGAQGAPVYQGDDGLFVWHDAQGTADMMDSHLAGLHALFSNSLQVGARQIDLDVTFGLDADSARSLTNRIGSALVAADEARASGLRWKKFDSAHHHEEDWKLSILAHLDTAIADGEIWVAYQPKLALDSNVITGAEALVRWTHPERGAISPADFVLAAEQHDRIENLTLHVLNEAIKSAASLNAHGTDFGIAVNLSARLLDRSYFPGLVDNLLKRHGLAARHLTLEITESAAIISKEQSLQLLHALRRLGVNISIDDYGTGQSTMEYLRTIPATEIKIDRSFVSGLAISHSDRVLVSSTIEMAHGLGLKVVAEGIETADILSRLVQMGCDEAQGYHIGRPMAFDALSALMPVNRATKAA